MVASTPNINIIITDSSFYGKTYEEFLKISGFKLEDPQITQGPGNSVEIRDPVLRGKLKLEIYLTDKPSMSLVPIKRDFSHILGNETFDGLEFINKYLYIYNVKYKDKITDIMTPISLYESIPNIHPEKILGVIPAKIGDTRLVYLIYEKTVIQNFIGGGPRPHNFIQTDDALFVNKDAVYLSPDGSLVMVSPKELLIFHKHNGIYDYYELAGNISLQNPKLKGIGNTVYIKDEATMKKGLCAIIELREKDIGFGFVDDKVFNSLIR